MNLRGAKNYTIALDLGTGSVGWAVIDEATGKIFHFNKKPTLGSRLFDSALTAESRRLSRGMRRRYDRRKYRIQLLQGFFAPEISKVDPEFFVRLRQSKYLPEDRMESTVPYRYTLFNDDNLNDVDFYNRFPSVYHLRSFLTKTTEKQDIRLVYLALHHIVKYRGNFLREDEKQLSAKNANMAGAIEQLTFALDEYAQLKALEFDLISSDLLEETFSEKGRRGAIKDKAYSIIDTPDKEGQKFLKQVINACLGYSAEFSQIFDIDKSSASKFSFMDEEAAESFVEQVPPEAEPLYTAMRGVYAAYVLQGILSDANGGTLSDAKIHEYESHHEQLVMLKALIKETGRIANNSALYAEFFREYNYELKNKESYGGYIAGKISQEDFFKFSKNTVVSKDLLDEKLFDFYEQLFEKQEVDEFIPKLRSSKNGVIPFQLHLEEAKQILDNQAKFYPFLKDSEERILSLISFRIPYYVGPLNAQPNPEGSQQFAWSVRNPGKENSKIYPWNFDEVIDKERTAEAFIRNMTKKCTYLYDQDVLPRNSLLYEEFCVLNELNNVRWSMDGVSYKRFDYSFKEEMIEDIFKKRKSVTHRAVSEWLKKKGFPNTSIKGTVHEDRFDSALGSYNDFCNLLGVDELTDSQIEDAERVVELVTLFEDRAMLRELIKREFGNKLTDQQINALSKKRYTGWGRLSRKFLTGLISETDNGPKNIMDILREGDQNNDRPGWSLNLMEIINDKNYDFKDLIEEYDLNRERIEVSDLQGSPALRRSITQALKIVEEIVAIAGNPPTKIVLESTRSEAEKKRTDSRYKKVSEALKNLGPDGADLRNELGLFKNGKIDDRLMLYFMQQGKCAYSGKPLDISNLSQYQIDHVLPQSYIKDDSLDNKVLCLASENQRKLNSLLLESSVIQKMRGVWDKWLKAGMISERKYRNLTRTAVSNEQMKGFIARQIVETSQVIKFATQLLRQEYRNTRVVSVRAGLSSELREKCGLLKSRRVNNYHHAHDAFLAAQISRFMDIRYPKLSENPIAFADVVKKYVERVSRDCKGRRGKLPQSSFIVDSFLRDRIDFETGEIGFDGWNAAHEVENIRRAFSYRDCNVTYMLSTFVGQYWKETIYPAGDKDAVVPLKMVRGEDGTLKPALSPDKYGGRTGVTNAYYFLWSATKGRKTVAKLSGYPYYCSEAGVSAQEYMNSLAVEEGLKSPKIILEKVYLHQRVKVGSDEFRIAGISTFVNSRETFFERDIYNSIAALENDGEVAAETMLKVYDAISLKMDDLCSAFRVVSKCFGDFREKFRDLSYEEQKNVLLGILPYLSGVTERADLKAMGLGDRKGRISSVGYWSGVVSPDSELYIADDSVTGLYVNWRSVGL